MSAVVVSFGALVAFVGCLHIDRVTTLNTVEKFVPVISPKPSRKPL